MTSHRLCICLCLRRAEMKMTIYSQERHVLSTRVVSPGEARVDELGNVPSLTGRNGLGFGCGIPSRMSRAVHLCPPPTRLLCSTWHVPASDSSATFTKDMIPVYVWCLTSCDKWEFFLKRVFQVRLKKKKKGTGFSPKYFLFDFLFFVLSSCIGASLSAFAVQYHLELFQALC